LERGVAAHVSRQQPEEVYTKGVFSVGGEATGERKVESASQEKGRADGEGEQGGRIVELVEMVVQGGGETKEEGERKGRWWSEGESTWAVNRQAKSLVTLGCECRGLCVRGLKSHRARVEVGWQDESHGGQEEN
jgi:hypothetical protein